MGIGKNVMIRYLGHGSIILKYLILRYILRFMFPILFKGITKNYENKTSQLASNVTFNSVNNIIFYTLTEVRKCRVVQKRCH